jgi:tetratricopeptide (TPR) repeat protein
MKDINVSYFPVEAPNPVPPAFGFLGRAEVLAELGQSLQTQTLVLLLGAPGVGKTELAGAYARHWTDTSAFKGPLLCFQFQHYVPLAQICDRVGIVFAHAIKAQSKTDWPALNAAQRRDTALAILRQNPCLMIWDDFDAVTPPLAASSKTPGAATPGDSETEAAAEQMKKGKGKRENAESEIDATTKQREKGKGRRENAEIDAPTGSTQYTATDRNELWEFLTALRGGQTKVLLTSQTDEPWLDMLDHRIALTGLHDPDARELAFRILQGTGLSASQIAALPPWTDLLARLQGHPLAMQLVLPDLRRKTSDALIQALGEPGLPPSLEATFATACRYRFDSLDPVLRRRLGVLGLFHGFVAARVLAALSFVKGVPDLLRELGREDWIRLLDAAADLGLLQRQAEGTYFIPPALQPRFHELLLQAFPNQVESLERAFCYIFGRAGNQLFQIYQANEQFATSLLSLERHNLLHAFRLARQLKDWDDLKEILCGLRTLLLIQGRWSEWDNLIASLESEAPEPDAQATATSEILWLRLMGHRAEICEYRRDFARLQAIHQTLKTRYGQAGERHQHADVLEDLGAVAETRGFIDDAERFYQKSASLKQQLGEYAGQAATLTRLADLALKQRRFRDADREYRQALEIWKQIGDADRQATTCCRLGAIGQERGELEEAETWYEQSLALRTRLGDQQRQALAYHQLGRIAQEQTLYPKAHERYLRSLEIRQRIGDDQGQAGTLYQLGRMARDQHEYAEAERFFRQALQIRERLGDETGQAQTIHQLGNVAFLQNLFDVAEPLYQQSLQIRIRLNDAHGQARNYNQLGKIAAARGLAEQADQYYQHAESLFDHLQNPFSGLRPNRE